MKGFKKAASNVQPFYQKIYFMEKTLTEIAFDKAKRYDNIVGFFVENFRGDCDSIPYECPRYLLDRYQMRLGDIDASLISFLKTIKEKRTQP